MPQITFILHDKDAVTVQAEAGQSLMQIAVAAGIEDIAAECGGACACGTCHCHIAPDWAEKLTAPAPEETDMIEFVIDPQPTSRLSCQIMVTDEMDGLTVTVPASQI